MLHLKNGGDVLVLETIMASGYNRQFPTLDAVDVHCPRWESTNIHPRGPNWKKKTLRWTQAHISCQAHEARRF